MNALPIDILRWLSPAAFSLSSQKRATYQQGIDALHDSDSNHPSNIDTSTIISTIAGPKMPQHLRTPERLMDEGFGMGVAGTETTARSLSLGTYYLLTREDVRRKLREELKQVMPAPDVRPTWNDLDKLPYMVSNGHMNLCQIAGLKDVSVCSCQ